MDYFSLPSAETIPILAALLLGLITAVSPCPMATNIAAIAYINRKISSRIFALAAGILYTAGRLFSYSILGIILIYGGLEIPYISTLLQNIGDIIIGPFLIVIGLLLLFIDRIPIGRGNNCISSLGLKISDWGIPGAFVLGIVFALAFCPYSAILYFGILIPLSLKSTGGILFPAIYAIGTSLPVLIIGIMIATGAACISSWMNILNRVQKLLYYLVSLVFIGSGTYIIIT